ncbi:MAG: CopG family antitoxin [Patescibacteria group bacterium]
MKKLKKIPKFKSAAEERKFWESVDSTEYVSYEKLEHWEFPNLKLTTKPITLRLPVVWIEKLKREAKKRSIPYQTLTKQLIYQNMSVL